MAKKNKMIKLQDMIFVMKLSKQGKNAYVFTFNKKGKCNCPECKYIEEICSLIDMSIEPAYKCFMRQFEENGSNAEACMQWCNDKKIKASFDVGQIKYNRRWRNVYITTDKSVLA